MNHPLPKDPRHQRFADLVLQGQPLVEAYLGAGFNCSRESAYHAGKRLRKRAEVEAYIQSIQSAAADESVLTILEKRRFLARVVRIGLAKLDFDNPDDPNADLIKSHSLTESESSTSRRIEKHDPLKAIQIDNDLDAATPANQHQKDLADAILALSSTESLPSGKL